MNLKLNRKLKVLCIALLASIFISIAGNNFNNCCCALPVKEKNCFSRKCGYPFLGYRSQSENLARRIVGSQTEVNKFDMAEYNGSGFVAVEYTRSFNPESIITNLLGSDASNCNILIQGSKVADRNPQAWLADNFGLPMDFDSKINFSPSIQNVIIDLNYYAGLDFLTQGAFFRLYAPIVYTKWDLNMCEKVNNAGEMCFPKGYMSASSIPRSELPAKFTDVMNGCTTFGNMNCPIKYGLMSTCALTDTKLADLRAELGLNFLQDEDYNLGLSFHIAAPTGTRPTGYYLFEPIVGNGKHWELGVGLTSSYIMWRSKEKENKFFGVYFDAVLTNMLKACQNRSFDFNCKPNSRYMLLENMSENSLDLNRCEGLCCQTQDDNSCCTDSCNCMADYIYSGKLSPAINITTQCVYSKIDIQADLALKLAYYCNNWSLDLGYNFWIRSGEKFYTNLDCCDKQCALKGDSYLYGKYTKNNIDYVVPLSATQSTSDIHGGTNYPLLAGELDTTESCDTVGVRASYNPRIDNPAKAYSYQFALSDMYCEVVDNTPNINTSIEPQVLCQSDLDMQKGPKAFTNKVFGHINYKWNNAEKRTNPYLGIGAEGEFGPRCECNSSCESQNIGVSQWGIWIKAGLSYE